MAVTLWLQRHAEPIGAAGRCYGRLDLPVPAPATAAAADAIAAVLPAGIAIAHSPAARCAQLALAVRARVPGPPPVPEPRIAELDFGAWEGGPWSAIGAAAIDAWTRDFADVAPGGGEPVRAFMARVAAARQHWLRAGQADVLWVSHAGVDRALTLLAAGIDCPERAADWPRAGLPFGAWHCYGAAGVPRPQRAGFSA